MLEDIGRSPKKEQEIPHWNTVDERGRLDIVLSDARLGEVGGTAVWVTDETVTAEALSKHAAQSLAKFKVPLPINVFFHREALPKGATGKLDKKGLRKRYGEEVERRPTMARL